MATQPTSPDAEERVSVATQGQLMWRPLPKDPSSHAPSTQLLSTPPSHYTPHICQPQSVTMSCADPIKRMLSPDGSGSDLHMGLKLAAGSASGGIGAVLTTPVRGCTCPHLAHMLWLNA